MKGKEKEIKMMKLKLDLEDKKSNDGSQKSKDTLSIDDEK